MTAQLAEPPFTPGALPAFDRAFVALLGGFLIAELGGAWALSRRALPPQLEAAAPELPHAGPALRPIPRITLAPSPPGRPIPSPTVRSPPSPAAPTAGAAEHGALPRGLLAVLGSSGQGSVSSAIDEVLGARSAADQVSSALDGAADAVRVTDALGRGIAARGARVGAIAPAEPRDAESLTAFQPLPFPQPKRDAVLGRALIPSDVPVELTGKLDRDALNRFVHARLKSIQACYERQLKRNPALQGRLLVRFAIEPSGNLQDVDIDEDTLGDEVVASCIRTAVRVWKTPFHPEAQVEVSYPFIFAPAS